MDEDDITIQVDDIDTIQVPVEGEDPIKGQAVVETEPKPAKKTKTRVSPEPDPDPTPTTPSAAETALAEAQAFAKQQEEARRAAETTAANERARADRAEQQRQQALKEAQDASERAASTELTMIESNIAAAQRELEAQQDAFTRAAEAGEFVKMGTIQTKIAKAAAALDRLEDAKSAIESRPAPVAQPATDPQPVNNTEKFLSGFSPNAQNWLRQHMDCLPPAYGGDAAKNNKMMQGHYAAMSQNLAEGSSDYFRVIEEHIGTRQPVAAPAASAAAVVTPAAPAAPAPKAAPVAAPVSREAPSATPQARNVREVRLTRDQQEMAKVSFPHVDEKTAFGMYARNLIELEAEGKIGRTSH